MKLTESELKNLILANSSGWPSLLIDALENHSPNSAALWYIEVISNIISLRNADDKYTQSWIGHLNEIKAIIDGTQALSIQEMAKKSKDIFHEFKDKNKVSILLSHAYAFQVNFILQEFDKYKRNMTLAATWFIDEVETIIPIMIECYNVQMKKLR